jgi:hypothetical protein
MGDDAWCRSYAATRQEFVVGKLLDDMVDGGSHAENVPDGESDGDEAFGRRAAIGMMEVVLCSAELVGDVNE